MKLRTAVISIVVSASLVAGAGYGAYNVMKGKKSPVEVVPVQYVRIQYYSWYDSGSLYGTVTSEISQNVTLNDDYTIAEIYVKEGDEVKEGDPLFAYDMTLEELELEMYELDLQSLELNMTKLEKDLEKYRKMTPTASLEGNLSVLTASAAEEVIEESEELPGDSTSAQETEAEQETHGSSGGLSIEGVEEVPGSNTQTGEKKDSESSIASAVSSFEGLVDAIEALIRIYGDELRSDEIGTAIEEAVSYYREYLADECVSSDAQGEEVREYVLKTSVREALGEEDTAELEEYSDVLSKCQVLYVEMMIDEAYSAQYAMTFSELAETVAEIEEQYAELETADQQEVSNLDGLLALQEVVEEESAAMTEPDIEAEERPEEESDSEAAGPETERADGGEEPGSENAGAALDGETEPDSENAGADVGTEDGETESGAGSTEAADSTEPAETETAPETEKTAYTVTVIKDGSVVQTFSYPAGEMIQPLSAENEESRVFKEWKISPSDTAVEYMDADHYSIRFVMPEADVTVEMVYALASDAVSSYVNAFTSMAEIVLAEGADESEDYLTELLNAVAFYQQWLSELPDEIINEEIITYEDYQLQEVIREVLTSQDNEAAAQQLEDTYRELCMTYAGALLNALDPAALDADLLGTASEVYAALGPTWQAEFEQSWQTQTGNTEITANDMLKAYEILLLYQNYLAIAENPEASYTDMYAAIIEAWAGYMGLSDVQRGIVTDLDLSILAVFAQYGLSTSDFETEPETEDETDGWDDWDGWGDYDDYESYTAEELRGLIKETEREIADCELDIREAKLTLTQQQRIVDGKVVTSTVDGTVVSIGGLDGDYEDDYFAKVTSTAGLYLKGNMNELSLDEISVGDTVSGMMMDTGISFTAVIKEISQYPASGGNDYYYSYGENSNTSYYPFYALIDDVEDLEEGEAEIEFAETMTNDEDSIYVEMYFVRTESNGKSYVYIQGDDGLLKKQYVTTGKTLWGSCIQIVSGLSLTDKIAFPYGSDVVEGAETKEVEMLSYY